MEERGQDTAVGSFFDAKVETVIKYKNNHSLQKQQHEHVDYAGLLSGVSKSRMHARQTTTLYGTTDSPTC